MTPSTPSFEVGYDNAAAEYEGERGLPYHPGLHVIVEGPFIQWLRRYTGNPRLVCYYHRFNASYTVGVWLQAPARYRSRLPVLGISETGPGLIVEVLTLNGHPDRDPHNGGASDVPENTLLRELFKPSNDPLKAARARVKDQAFKKAELKKANWQDRQDLAKHLKRKGFEDVGDALAAGGTPFLGESADPEGYRRVKEQYEAAKKMSFSVSGLKQG